MNKVIDGLYSKKVLKVMNEMLDDFILSDSSVDDIYDELKYINESIRTGIYLLSIEKGFTYLSQRISIVNERINLERTEDFIKAINDGEEEKYLATLGKGDKVSLLNHLGINVPLEQRRNLSKEQLNYYKVISASIKDSQEDDKRDGIDSFLRYKKDKA